MGVRILLVEDDAALGELVVEALAEDGHATTHVDDPERAFALAESREWDLFIVDGFGGSTVQPDATYCTSLRRLSEYAPVLVTTGRAWARDTPAQMIGAQAVLPKPYDLEQLAGHVAALGPPAG